MAKIRNSVVLPVVGVITDQAIIAVIVFIIISIDICVILKLPHLTLGEELKYAQLLQ